MIRRLQVSEGLAAAEDVEGVDVVEAEEARLPRLRIGGGLRVRLGDDTGGGVEEVSAAASAPARSTAGRAAACRSGARLRAPRSGRPGRSSPSRRSALGTSSQLAGGPGSAGPRRGVQCEAIARDDAMGGLPNQLSVTRGEPATEQSPLGESFAHHRDLARPRDVALDIHSPQPVSTAALNAVSGLAYKFFSTPVTHLHSSRATSRPLNTHLPPLRYGMTGASVASTLHGLRPMGWCGGAPC